MFGGVSLCTIGTILLTSTVYSYPEQGKWTVGSVTNDQVFIGVHKSLFRDSDIYITVDCESKAKAPIEITWVLRETACFKEYQALGDGSNTSLPLYKAYFENPNYVPPGYNNANAVSLKSEPYLRDCTLNIQLPLFVPNDTRSIEDVKGKEQETDGKERAQRDLPSSDANTGGQDKKVANNAGQDMKVVSKVQPNKPDTETSSPAFTVDSDGVYLLVVNVVSPKKAELNVTLQIRMKGKNGYLSAVDWPLLPFYITMCVVYIMFGVAWLVVSFCQWRDLLRIQFWIGGVIFLGMLEKAVFCAEYESINATGQSVRGAVISAEIVSCAKRTLARMLVIIVSLGFGIVKPRLGPLLHRVVGVGFLYFVLASVEAVLRVVRPVNVPSNQQVLLAGVPLSVLDSLICWWIFTSIVHTTRNLRLRRNLVKLSLYRHFTNTLIFAVLASVAFMLWSIKYIQLDECLTDWKEFWVDQAYWHILFSVILLVIMILWRPTNNNQRYAFTPLLDNPEDDEDDEQQCSNDAFEGMKLRGKSNNSPNSHRNSSNLEDDLKWIEEHIPSSIADSALPVLDSDEEIMTTKFEMSKMQ